MTLTTFQTLLGMLMIGLGLYSVAISVLLERGRLKPNSGWGRSASQALWQGLGILAWGLGNLSHLVAPWNVAVTLRIIGALVFIAAILVGRRKVAAEI